jgi:hypothetical protein
MDCTPASSPGIADLERKGGIAEGAGDADNQVSGQGVQLGGVVADRFSALLRLLHLTQAHTTTPSTRRPRQASNPHGTNSRGMDPKHPDAKYGLFTCNSSFPAANFVYQDFGTGAAPAAETATDQALAGWGA